MSQDIGRKLHEKGWTQGALLNTLAISIVFAPDRPVSKLARAAARKAEPDTRLSPSVPHGVAFGIPSSTIRLVVISQACDIVKPLNEEPNVFAMPVFRTDNVKILGPAARNSSRYFLLDPDRGYVVDATSCVVIEKPLLETLSPEVGATTHDARRRFARWITRRFNRPALPDDVVAVIVRPILENLRILQAQGALDMGLLDQIAEVRLHVTNDSMPFTFDLLFLVDNPGEGFEVALAPLLGEMRSWFTPPLAALRNWYALGYGDISVADYLESEQLYLDQYSYEGGTIHGLVAPDPD